MQDFIESQEKVKLREGQPSGSWPSPQDYNESVQNPGFSFLDSALINAEPELNAIGLPKPASGNFASVYRLFAQAEEWAVRCFLQPLADQQCRYAALSEKLSTIDAPYFARFEYLENGIRVRQQWYPIIKMEWVHGQSLTEYIKEHLNDPVRLNALADEFKKMVLSMRTHGIAHGDLQHGNIIVQSDGSIRLVDYDGCFVPELSGLKSNELGHRNYQHPMRASDDFNENIDNFSAWLIWISIKAVAEDPHLWDKLHGGDECLLFRRQDFLRSNYSRAFHLLEMNYSENLRHYGKFLRSLLHNQTASVVPLDAEPEAPHALPPLESIVELSNATEPKPKASVKEKVVAAEIDVFSGKRKMDQDRFWMKVVLVIMVLPTLVAVLILMDGFAGALFKSKPPASNSKYAKTVSAMEQAENGAPAPQDLDRGSKISSLLWTAQRKYNQHSYAEAMPVLQEAIELDNDGVSCLDAREKGQAYMRLGECKRQLATADYGASDFVKAHTYLKNVEGMKRSAFNCLTEAAYAAMSNHNYENAYSSFLLCLSDENASDSYQIKPIITNATYTASKLFMKSGSTEPVRQLWSYLTALRKPELLEYFLGILQSDAVDLGKEDKDREKTLLYLVIDLANSRPDIDKRFYRSATELLGSMKQDNTGASRTDESENAGSGESSSQRLPRPAAPPPSTQAPRSYNQASVRVQKDSAVIYEHPANSASPAPVGAPPPPAAIPPVEPVPPVTQD